MFGMIVRLFTLKKVFSKMDAPARYCLANIIVALKRACFYNWQVNLRIAQVISKFYVAWHDGYPSGVVSALLSVR